MPTSFFCRRSRRCLCFVFCNRSLLTQLHSRDLFANLPPRLPDFFCLQKSPGCGQTTMSRTQRARPWKRTTDKSSCRKSRLKGEPKKKNAKQFVMVVEHFLS